MLDYKSLFKYSFMAHFGEYSDLSVASLHYSHAICASEVAASTLYYLNKNMLELRLLKKVCIFILDNTFFCLPYFFRVNKSIKTSMA